MDQTRITLIDLNKAFDPEKVVTNPNPIKDGDFTVDGIFSEKIFGPEIDVDNIDSIAWIDLGVDSYIINPLIYTRLAKLMKPSILDAIISFNMRIDVDGKFKPELDKEDSSNRGPKIDDANVGLWEFRENFMYYLNKYTIPERKTFPEYRQVIKWYLQDKVFINKFPIFSPKLRPAQIFSHDNTFQFSPINTYYNLLIKHSNNIKNIKGDINLEDIQFQKIKILYRLQGYANYIVDKIIENIKGKRGIIRKNVLGARLNFSARNVIVPNPHLAVNEIVVNYTTFLALYKIPLINLISRSEGKDYLTVKKILDDAEIVYNHKVYRYMMELVQKTKGNIHALLNRNPSISISSIQNVKIVDINPDIESSVMEVSNNILSGLAGDFDGDVLNLIALFNLQQYLNFFKIDPAYQIISNNDGRFNRTFSLTKDAKLGAYLLNVNADSESYEIVD